MAPDEISLESSNEVASTIVLSVLGLMGKTV
jgi:hypothetical protein